MSEAFGKITEKVGKKGQASPTRIPDVESIPCPRVSKKVNINHSLINLSGTVVCEFCKVSWADLDQQVREVAAEAARTKVRVPR